MRAATEAPEPLELPPVTRPWSQAMKTAIALVRTAQIAINISILLPVPIMPDP